MALIYGIHPETSPTEVHDLTTGRHITLPGQQSGHNARCVAWVSKRFTGDECSRLVEFRDDWPLRDEGAIGANCWPVDPPVGDQPEGVLLAHRARPHRVPFRRMATAPSPSRPSR